MNKQQPPTHSPISGAPLESYQRPDSDRWLNDSVSGWGSAGHGKPLHSVRKRRRVFVLSVLGLSVGALLILFNSPVRNEFLAPGPLTSQHAQILAGMGGDRCAACHQAGRKSWLSWVGLNAATSQESCPTRQSELCLKCHQQSIPAELATNPHSLSGGQLQQLTEAQHSKFRLAGTSLPGRGPSRQLECSACHDEHQGVMVDLTAMSDQQCQTCHAQRHQSFEQDHPDFALAGMQLPSVIHFDHGSHLKKYFPEGQQKFVCASCHVGDSQRNVMRLANYEAMCGTCHNQTIRTTGQQGLVLLELPILNLEQMRMAGVEIGQWPAGAQGDFNGQLHPLTWTLLYRDESLRGVLSEFPAGFDFSEIDVANEVQLRRLGELVLGMKGLLVELGSKEFPEVLHLQSASAGADSSLQFFRDSVATWFPEMANKGSTAQEAHPVGSSIWLPDAGVMARWLQEQERELLVTNPLAGKVSPAVLPELAPSGSRSAQVAPLVQPTVDAEPSRQVFQTDTNRKQAQPVDDGNRREQAIELPPLRKGIQVPLAASSGDSVVLADNPLKKLAGKASLGSTADTQALNEEQTTDSIENLGPQRTEHAPPHHSAVNQPEQAPAIEPVFSSPVRNQLPQPSLLRGWRRDDQSFKLVYFIADHQDRLWPELYSWLEQLRREEVDVPALTHATEQANASQGEAARVLGDWLSNSTTAGACLSCHQPQSFAAQVVSSQLVGTGNWASRMRMPEQKGFTRFNHAPHLLQLKCNQCHLAIEGEGSEAGKSRTLLANWKATAGEGVRNQASDFAAIERATCVQCHQQNQAPNSCTTCHTYHVDQQWMKTLDCLRSN